MATVDDPVEEEPITTVVRPTLRRRIGRTKRSMRGTATAAGRSPRAAGPKMHCPTASSASDPNGAHSSKKTLDLIAHCLSIGQRSATVSIKASGGILANTE